MDERTADTTESAPPTSPAFKLEKGASVMFFARRAGGDVSRFEGTIKALARKGEAGETIEFDFEGGKRVAEGIRRGSGEADAPCWAPA